ncbi:hypothetical protein V8C26DRAFT_398038 [Trichoderma gracile]
MLASVNMARGPYEVVLIVPVHGCRLLTFPRSRPSPTLNTSPSTMHRHEPRDQRHVESHRSQSFLQLWRRIGTGHQEATASDATPPMYATVHMSYQHHCRRQHRNIEYRKRKVVKARDQCISGREHMRALSTVISASAHAKYVAPLADRQFRVRHMSTQSRGSLNTMLLCLEVGSSTLVLRHLIDSGK